MCISYAFNVCEFYSQPIFHTSGLLTDLISNTDVSWSCSAVLTVRFFSLWLVLAAEGPGVHLARVSLMQSVAGVSPDPGAAWNPGRWHPS